MLPDACCRVILKFVSTSSLCSFVHALHPQVLGPLAGGDDVRKHVPQITKMFSEEIRSSEAINSLTPTMEDLVAA